MISKANISLYDFQPEEMILLSFFGLNAVIILLHVFNFEILCRNLLSYRVESTSQAI